LLAAADRFSAARERRVRADQLLERHFRIAQRQAEAVVRRGVVESFESRIAKKAKIRLGPDFVQQRDGGDILRSRERRARAQRSAITAVVVTRRVDDSVFTSRKMRRHIRKNSRG
jgi:hypothetical protein